MEKVTKMQSTNFKIWEILQDLVNNGKEIGS